eukprot:Lithocolla_globosa_v1_NODE_3106_length_1765_cov_9.874269.p2 type:complete len:102 gc:universal NODE_3106_length_1765_cov_9.874269:1700-1395(-)
MFEGSEKRKKRKSYQDHVIQCRQDLEKKIQVKDFRCINLCDRSLISSSSNKVIKHTSEIHLKYEFVQIFCLNTEWKYYFYLTKHLIFGIFSLFFNILNFLS